MQPRKPVDRRSRTRRVNPDASLFDELSSGILRLKSLSVAEGPVGRLLSSVRHIILGMPLRTAEEAGERIPKLKAFPILAANNIPISQGPVVMREGYVAVFVRDPDRNVIELRGLQSDLAEPDSIAGYTPEN